MCHPSVIEFFILYADPLEFVGKRVLEVGSKYVNGSVRPFIQRWLRPREYVGVDIEPGIFVDALVPAERLVDYFGEGSFDVVISTELLEHVHDWRLVINNMKRILKPGGIIYITTRSIGFPYHAYPHDYWRYEIDDMREIFSDFEIIKLTRDWLEPGVFLKARKPMDWKPKDLSNIELYSMILGRRTRETPTIEQMPPMRKVALKIINSRLLKALMPGGVAALAWRILK